MHPDYRNKISAPRRLWLKDRSWLRQADNERACKRFRTWRDSFLARAKAILSPCHLSITATSVDGTQSQLNRKTVYPLSKRRQWQKTQGSSVRHVWLLQELLTKTLTKNRGIKIKKVKEKRIVSESVTEKVTENDQGEIKREKQRSICGLTKEEPPYEGRGDTDRPLK